MNRKSKIFLGIVLTLFVLSIVPSLMLQKNVEQKFYDRMPSEVDQLSKTTLDRLMNNEESIVIENMSAEALELEGLKDGMFSVVEFLSSVGEIESLELIGYNLFEGFESEEHSLSYELLTSKGYLIYSAKIVLENNEYKLHGIDFQGRESSMKEANGLTFANKSIGHYIIILVSIVILIVSLYTASICFGTMEKRKYIRTLFILCGIGKLSFNWTTGMLFFNFLSIHIPTVALNRAGTVAPFILRVSLPLGVILYWFKWRNEEIKEQNESEVSIEHEIEVTNDGL